MCGISGFNFSDEKLIQAMNNKLKHRGPDNIGHFVDGDISLGHTRLSVIDLSKRGNQPMFSHDKNYAITYNGELYNFQEIKEELEASGFKFYSNTDTEVILNAYIAYGSKCLQKFNGIFAFAIWDKKHRQLFAARDHFGIKPLFYYFKDNKFIFASEIKAILEHSVDKQLDYQAMNMFFRFSYIQSPKTMFKHIKKLRPGHYLILKGSELKISQYYHLPDKIVDYSFDEAKELLKNTFDESVKRQLVSDRPLGIFLSGGIDSTAILGAMSKTVNHKIKTFTVKFDVDVQEKKFNEDSRLAWKSSKYYNTEHCELLVKPQDVVDNLEKVVYHIDDPIANHTQVATFLLAQRAKQDVAVVLGGDGGDELFGGYQRYYYYHLIDKLQNIPRFLRHNFLAQGTANALGKADWYDKLNSRNAFELFWQFRSQPEKHITQALRPSYNDLSSIKKIIEDKSVFQSRGSLTEVLMKADFSTWLADESLAKTDRLTMAFGLEERVPILDKEMVELAMTIPTKYKIASKEQGKHIFKVALNDYLPDYVYDKPKTGWFSPAAKWLRTGLKDSAYQILSEGYNSDTKEFFDFRAIRKILDNHIDQTDYALNIIWSLLTFQIWYRLYK